jgi:hypothetical protein
MNAKAISKKNQVSQVNIFKQDEIVKRTELIGQGLGQFQQKMSSCNLSEKWYNRGKGCEYHGWQETFTE